MLSPWFCIEKFAIKICGFCINYQFDCVKIQFVFLFICAISVWFSFYLLCKRERLYTRCQECSFSAAVKWNLLHYNLLIIELYGKLLYIYIYIYIYIYDIFVPNLTRLAQLVHQLSPSNRRSKRGQKEISRGYYVATLHSTKVLHQQMLCIFPKYIVIRHFMIWK